MAKVEGSSPFIRSHERPANESLLAQAEVRGSFWMGRARVASTGARADIYDGRVACRLSAAPARRQAPSSFRLNGTAALPRALNEFERHYNEIAKPFEWNFTRQDLADLLARLDQPVSCGPSLALVARSPTIVAAGSTKPREQTRQSLSAIVATGSRVMAPRAARARRRAASPLQHLQVPDRQRPRAVSGRDRSEVL